MAVVCDYLDSSLSIQVAKCSSVARERVYSVLAYQGNTVDARAQAYHRCKNLFGVVCISLEVVTFCMQVIITLRRTSISLVHLTEQRLNEDLFLLTSLIFFVRYIVGRF